MAIYDFSDKLKGGDKKTAEAKYGKYLIEAPIAPAKHGPPVPTLNSSAAAYGINAS